MVKAPEVVLTVFASGKDMLSAHGEVLYWLKTLDLLDGEGVQDSIAIKKVLHHAFPERDTQLTMSA